tara:strand:- start:341 stop:622 length:282 start_codon:yes stop_codon:yes gene_type:complete
MSSSCSFRITRTAEDLALTVTKLSQRLVKLEQRLEVLEKESSRIEVEPPAKQIEMLDGVDQMLRECQEILQTPVVTEVEEIWSEEDPDEIIAA